LKKMTRTWLSAAAALLLGTAAAGAAEPQIVLLKLDDCSGPFPRYRETAEFILKEGLKVNFGVFGSALEKNPAGFDAWLNAMVKTGAVEFWNHGYGGFGHAKENQEGTPEEIRARIFKTQDLSAKILPRPFAAFGPHAGGMNEAAWQALADRPEIRLVFASPPPQFKDRFIVASNRVRLDFENLLPDKDKFIANWEQRGKDLPYIVVQTHPNTWTEDRYFEQFKAAVLFLKEKGCRFMTVSEYVATVEAQKR